MRRSGVPDAGWWSGVIPDAATDEVAAAMLQLEARGDHIEIQRRCRRPQFTWALAPYGSTRPNQSPLGGQHEPRGIR